MAGGNGDAKIGTQKFAGGGAVYPFVLKAVHAIKGEATEGIPMVVNDEQGAVLAKFVLPLLPTLEAVIDACGALGAGG